MSYVEESIVRMIARAGRSAWLNVGARITLASMALGVLCSLPILLYIRFGPADGNPIGLGLISVAGNALAAVGIAIGVVWMAIDVVRRSVRS